MAIIVVNAQCTIYICFQFKSYKIFTLTKKKKKITLLFMLTEIYNKFYDGDSRKKRDICLGIVTPEKKEGT